jgi:hypothetical protein
LFTGRRAHALESPDWRRAAARPACAAKKWPNAPISARPSTHGWNRAGALSADVVDRIARALMLADVEREHFFLLGLARPPDARYRKADGVTPRLQRVLERKLARRAWSSLELTIPDR